MRLWGGRFSEQPDVAASKFHSSIGFDIRLYRHDIAGSVAHAQMLGARGIIPSADAEAIAEALEGILRDIESGALAGPAAPDGAEGIHSFEDIHSFVEAELVSRIGDAGRRLHTGRSRNDQVALDMRMYVMEEIDAVRALLMELLETLARIAEEHAGTIMPGYTHMQKAQPVTLGHHMLAYFEMFKRDYQRLGGCRERTDEMPLGSGALASTPYPIDREFVKEKLRFSKITANSIDAVSDRDFCVEYVSCLSIAMMHLSRFCEELVLWSAEEFGFAVISDAYATGSSIMPQKKNPDTLELVRGKTGRVYGSLMGLLTMMKGLPLAYNKDMQEDKEAVFDASDTAKACLSVFVGTLGGVTFNKGAMRAGALGGYANATDAADWLVRRGVPFRDAHRIVGGLVLRAAGKRVPLEALPLEDMKAASGVFDETVYEAITVEACVDVRGAPGGPGSGAVREAIANAKLWMRQAREAQETKDGRS